MVFILMCMQYNKQVSVLFGLYISKQHFEITHIDHLCTIN